MSAASPTSAARRRSTWPWAIGVFVVALPFLWYRAQRLKEWEDEGYFANGALRVLAGQVVYRDFQHNYPPGRTYSLALLIAVFGHHLWVVRAFWAVLQASAAALGFLVARRLAPTALALAAGASIALNTAFMNKSAELCASAAVLWILCRVHERRTSDLAAGALLALVALFRHDVAAFGLVVLPFALLLPAGGERFDARAAVRRLAAAWRVLAGGALVLAPWVIYLARAGALRVAGRDLWLSGYLANKLLSLPFPPLVQSWSAAGVWEALGSERALFYAVPATYAAAAGLALARLGSRAADAASGVRGDRADLGARAETGAGAHASGAAVSSRPSGPVVAAPASDACAAVRVGSPAVELLLVALFGALVFVQVLPRTDFGHLSKAFVPAHVAAVALLAAALCAAREALRARRPARSALACLGVAAALYLPVLHVARHVLGIPNSIPVLIAERGRYVAVDFPRGRMWILRGPAEKYAPLFDVLAPWAGASGEWLVVYPAGAMLNFVLDLPSPLRHDLLRPGEMAGQEFSGELVPNHPLTLDEIDRRLAETRPRFLIDSAEDTNHELRLRLQRFAQQRGYRRHEGARFTLWVRPDTPEAR